MGGGKPLFFVWVAVVIFCYSNFCYADGNVGCLFSQTVCLVNEWCYDDFAFGKCLPIYEGDVTEDDKFRYSMTKFDLEKFEEELQHLVDLGYHWEHAYTQCIIQAMLQAARFSGSVDTSICASFADFNTMAINPDNPDSEMDGPRELAFVKFTPNSNLAKTDFANEVYWPSQYVEDLKPSNDEHMSASLFNEDINPEARDQLRNSLQVPSESNNKHEVFSSREDAFEHLKNLNNFVGPREGSSIDNANDYNLPEVIKLLNKYRPNLQSENYAESPARKVKKSAFSENHNGIAVVEFPASDYEDNKVDDEQLASLSDSLDNSHSQYPPSTAEFITENRMDPEQINLFTNFIKSIKSSFKDTVDFKNLQNNVLPESRIYVEEDEPELYRLDSGSGEVGPKGLFDVNGDIAIEGPIINDYRDGDLYSSGSIKKLLRHWSEESKKLKENKKNDFTVLYAEGGVVYPVDEVGKTPSQIQDLMENYDWGFNRQERLDVKKPGPPFDVKTSNKEENKTSGSELSAPPAKKGTEHENHNHNDFEVDTSYAYVGFKDSFRSWKEGAKVVHEIGELLHLEPSAFTYPRIDRNEVTFRVDTNSKGLNAIDVAKSIDNIKDDLQSRLGVVVTTAGVGDKSKDPAVLIAPNDSWKWDEWVEWGWGGWGVMAATVILTVTSCVMLALIVRRNAKRRSKLQGLASDTDTEATQHYQDLCRARMSGKQQQVGTGILGTIIDPGAASTQRVTTLSRDSDGNSPSNRSSTSSWSEEPALTNMDISTGHMVLAYMEDHLKNKDRLEQEWEALCAYDAEPCTTLTASANDNVKKNRYPDVLPYDHARVTLNQLTNHLGSDYINASTITDHDPRNPAYIASQGPLPHTTADFWQMVWEQGSVVMVMLTRLTENGTVMCHRYWSEDGSALYHIYEVHLVSEHIWCDDYLVRSFYLKNIKTGETRTVTQFHFLSWPENGVPSSTKALLEFRRKVNKSYRGRSCPIVVHCSDGASRTGTYCLIDMVLNRMAKGAKEIDIAATLEHIRDQRPNMVTTKHQFEFVLMAVAEEVHAILKALPSQLQQQKEAAKEKESG